MFNLVNTANFSDNMPQINPSFIAAGLKAAIVPTAGGVIDVVNKIPSSVDTSSKTMLGQTPSMSFDASKYVEFNSTSNYDLTGAFSAVILGYIRSFTNYSFLVGKQGTTTTNCPFEIRFGGNGPTDYQISVTRGGASGYYRWISTNALNQLGIVVITVSCSNGNISTPPVVILNDTILTMTMIASSGSGTVSSGGTLRIGRRFDNICQLDGIIRLLMLFDKPLSLTEHLYITAGRASPDGLYYESKKLPVSWNPDPGIQNASIAHGPYPLVQRPSVVPTKGSVFTEQLSKEIVAEWAPPSVRASDTYMSPAYCAIYNNIKTEPFLSPSELALSIGSAKTLIGGSVVNGPFGKGLRPTPSAATGSGGWYISPSGNARAGYPAFQNTLGDFTAGIIFSRDSLTMNSSSPQGLAGQIGMFDGSSKAALGLVPSAWGGPSLALWHGNGSTVDSVGLLDSKLQTIDTLQYVFYGKRGTKLWMVLNGMYSEDAVSANGAAFSLDDDSYSIGTWGYRSTEAENAFRGVIYAHFFLPNIGLHEQLFRNLNNPWEIFGRTLTVQPPFPGPRRKLM